MKPPIVRAVVMLVLAAALAGGCGDDAGTPPTPTPSTDAPPDPDARPSLSVTVEGLEGYAGRIVVGILRPASGTGPVGSVCLPIDGTPWTGTGVVSTFDPTNPCGKEAPYGAVIDAEGGYLLELGVLVPGETAPEACFETTVAIEGPSRVTVAGTDLVTDCT